MYVVFTHQKDIRPLMDIPVYQLFEQIVCRAKGAQVHICTETCTDGIGNGCRTVILNDSSVALGPFQARAVDKGITLRGGTERSAQWD